MIPQSEQILLKFFGFRSFRSHQKEVINSVLHQNDTLAILPTGNGKSLCYQIPALIFDGVTLVISPLLSLMKDQVDELNKKQIPACYINSTLSFPALRHTLAQVCNKKFKIVYIAPERIQTRAFQFVLEHLIKKNLLSLVAVDEAHCISQWGQDFRPAYRQIKMIRSLCNIPFLAVTATATKEVREDILQQLLMKPDTSVFIGGLNRENLHYRVLPASDKQKTLDNWLELHKTSGPGIIFCATRKSVETVYNFLKSKNMSCGFYHGGRKDFERHEAQNLFLSGKIMWMVATNAFGMGIDKADIRHVLHYEMPGSIEQYLQESGRAGRDGKPSECSIFYSYEDQEIHRFFIESASIKKNIAQKLIDFFGSFKKTTSLKDSEIIAKNEEIQSELEGKRLLSYLNLLEEIGFFSFSTDQNQRTYTLNENYDPFLLSFGYLDKKTEEAYRKLELMNQYCIQNGCYRAYLQRYFSVPATLCHNCGGCSGENRRTTASDLVSKTVIDFVKHHEMSYGVGTVTEILCGSVSRKINTRDLHQSHWYGKLSKFSQTQVKEKIRTLLNQGVLIRTTGEYPKISLNHWPS